MLSLVKHLDGGLHLIFYPIDDFMINSIFLVLLVLRNRVQVSLRNVEFLSFARDGVIKALTALNLIGLILFLFDFHFFYQLLVFLFRDVLILVKVRLF